MKLLLTAILYNSLISSKFPCGKLKTYVALFLKKLMIDFLKLVAKEVGASLNLYLVCVTRL